MRRKNKGRMIALTLIIGILAAIPASTQVLSGDRTDANDEANLGMVILINRLELTRDQMEAIHDSLASILSEIDELDSSREAFYDQMLQFNGTADELDQALSAFRDQMSAAESAVRDDMKAAIDRIAETLTMKQGEILRRAIPGLFERMEEGPQNGSAGMIGPGRLPGQRGRMFANRVSEQDGMRGAIMERLQSRIQSGSTNGIGPAAGRPKLMQRDMERKVDLLRRFVETLELKLNYVE